VPGLNRSPSTRTLERIHDALLARFGPQNWWPGETPFEIMVGAVLTQNTAWGNVERAVANLRAAGVLHPRALLRLSPSRLTRLIRPSGYFNVKARRLRDFVAWLVGRIGDQYPVQGLRGIATPRLRRELLSVRGIGEETADSMLLYALGRKVFVVDAYTRRFLARHGLIEPAASYGAIQALFEKSLPRSRPLFNEFHALIVALGKNLCRPRNPRCGECPLLKVLGAPSL